MNDTPAPPEKPKAPVDAPKTTTSDTPPPASTQPGRPTTNGESPKPGSRADVRAAVRDAQAAGIKADIEAQPHKVAPDVRAAKGQTGATAESAHVVPTAALRDTNGYVRGDALTASLPPNVHRAMDRQWQSAFRELAKEGKTELTVRELQDVVGKAIQGTPGLTAKQKGTLEWMLDKELKDLGLQSSDKVRLPYSKDAGQSHIAASTTEKSARSGGNARSDKSPAEKPVQGNRVDASKKVGESPKAGNDSTKNAAETARPITTTSRPRGSATWPSREQASVTDSSRTESGNRRGAAMAGGFDIATGMINWVDHKHQAEEFQEQFQQHLPEIRQKTEEDPRTGTLVVTHWIHTPAPPGPGLKPADRLVSMDVYFGHSEKEARRAVPPHLVEGGNLVTTHHWIPPKAP